jgi:hypothetical protein
MKPSLSLHRCLAVVLSAALALVVVAPPAGAATADRHCVLNITGEDPVTHEAFTGPLTCSTTQAGAMRAAGVNSLLSVVIATHYTGSNFTGSTLSVMGDACDGEWINMPAAWVDVVSSTRSVCAVTHYDLFYLAGASFTIFNPGGNLIGFDNRTKSAVYS